MKNKISINSAAWLVLIAVCAANLFTALPIIGNNINDPGLIAYFNHDEGYIMDLLWYYYSGQKSPSYQYDRDYGLEFRYLSDFARIVLSKFFAITPGTFVLILRWLNLITWILSIIALWFLMRRHFGPAWYTPAAVLLLGTSPAFAALCGNSKPDSLTLLLMLIGLHYALRITESPRPVLVFAAAVFASAAFLVKYVGIFLLPAIVAAMSFSAAGDTDKKAAFPVFRFSHLLPAACGLPFMALPPIIIFLYRRRTSGLTWYEEYGFWQSIANNKELAYFMVFGIFLVVISIGTLLLKKLPASPRAGHFTDIVGRINSNGITAAGFFVISCLVMGFRWILRPSLFIDLCAQTGRDAFGYTAAPSASTGLFLVSIADNLKNVDSIFFALILIYIIIEFSRRRHSLIHERGLYFKRLTLAVFILPILPYAVTGARLAQHHLLPFFAAAIILALEGIRMLLQSVETRAFAKGAVVALTAAAIICMAAQNMARSGEAFAYLYHQRDDVIFDVVKWMRENCPRDARILADHPTRAYLPPEYTNARAIRSLTESGRVEEMGRAILDFKPDFIYYNTSIDRRFVTPPMEEIAPGLDVKLAASFDGTNRRYQRWKAPKYMIYRASY